MDAVYVYVYPYIVYVRVGKTTIFFGPARSSFSWHGTVSVITIFNFRPVWARENLFSSMF